MSKNFYQGKDSSVYTGSNTFSTLISATPGAFGISVPAAAEYATLNQAYGEAYLAAIEPATRTKSAVEAKNQAKRALQQSAANLVRIINGTPTVTDQQKIDLGINVRATPTPNPIPDSSPVIEIKSVQQNIVTITLHGVDDNRRGKPSKVAACVVYSHIGNTPPANILDWKPEGYSSKAEAIIEFPISAEPFAQVWITAQWLNRKGQPGLATTPITTNLGTWLVQQAA